VSLASERRPSREEAGATMPEGVLVASEVASVLHSYDAGLGAGFVGREREVERLLGGVLGKLWGNVTALYGPRGCGKTALFRALDWAFHRLGLHGRGLSLIVLEREPATGDVIVRGPRRFLERAPGIMWGRFLKPAGVEAGAGTPFLRLEVSGPRRPNPQVEALAAIMFELEPEEGSGYVVVADGYRVEDAGVTNASLNVLANWVADVNREARWRGSRVAVLIASGDAMMAEVATWLGGKVMRALIWNLPRQDAEELASRLGLHEGAARELGLGREAAGELLWRLAGGNPGALRRIREVGVRAWLAEDVIGALERLSARLGGEAPSLFERVAGDVDSVVAPQESYLEFLRENIVMNLSSAYFELTDVPRGEPWVGKRFAFQLPAYHYAMKAVARKGAGVEPREVVEEALRG